MMILVLGGGCIACEFIAEPGTVSHGAHLGGALPRGVRALARRRLARGGLPGRGLPGEASG